MLWVNEIKFAKNEIDTVQEWNQEWDICCEWNEIYFISFMVADQDASQQLSRIHDVDGSYQSVDVLQYPLPRILGILETHA